MTEGFVANELELEIPQSVSLAKEYIPNVYSFAQVVASNAVQLPEEHAECCNC